MNKEKGISLIALVITIIVLLILAGVTIATLTGDSGLLTKASEAKKTNEKATTIEKIQVEVTGSYGVDGKINEEQLNNNLKRISGLKYNNATLSDENPIELPAIVEVDNESYQITNEGEVFSIIPQAIGNLTKDNYGDYLDLGQSVIGTSSTSDDWRILYNDADNDFGGTDGARVYAILADYLPNDSSVVEESGLQKVTDTKYNITSTLRAFMLNSFENKNTWQSLIPEILQDRCQVKGTTTVEILMASYNKKYNIVPAINYTDYPYFYINNDSSKGIDILYVPHPGEEDYYGCWGYWLDSPLNGDAGCIWRVGCRGGIYYYKFNNPSYGVRPVVSLPSNIMVSYTTSNGKAIWKVI